MILARHSHKESDLPSFSMFRCTTMFPCQCHVMSAFQPACRATGAAGSQGTVTHLTTAAGVPRAVTVAV